MTFQEITAELSAEIGSLNEIIAKALHSEDTPLMNEITGRYLQTKGKQIRPVMVMLCSRMFGDIDGQVLHAAASLELLHNASLIHDDVVDETKRRRGRDTINAVWDNHIAVLVGDFFVSRALSLASSVRDLRVVDTLAGLGALLSLGEMDQLDNAREHSLTEQGYFDIITHKTASLFVACVEVGAYSVGVTDSRLDTLRQFATVFGQCFQITDDIFDYYPSDKLGKPTGNDLREGKVTLPLLCALASGHPEAPAMREMLHNDMLSDTQIATLIDFAVRAGGIDRAREKLHALRDEGHRLASAIAPGLSPNPLSVLLDFVIERES